MWQKYGQHFLHDEQVLWAIAQSVEQLAKTHAIKNILEIWPGKWALTRYLLRMPYVLQLSEIDTSLRDHLEKLCAGTKTKIMRGDVLHQSFETVDSNQTLVVGNLPYYITSPIMRLFFGDQRVGNFPAWVFLIQEEVAQKIRRDAQKKSYLRWLVNRTSQVHYAFTVKAASFSPPPKVVSAVIVVEKLASGSEVNINEDRLLAFLNIASPFKRKTLWKIEKMQKEQCDRFGFFVPEELKGKRLEELGCEEMMRIVGN
jgi:16S rRNA (adenine1518-N6/adenine1519-N6)-dimethyltransferase